MGLVRADLWRPAFSLSRMTTALIILAISVALFIVVHMAPRRSKKLDLKELRRLDIEYGRKDEADEMYKR